MTDLLSRPRMTTARLIANILVAIVLAAVLAGLVIIVIERCEKNVREPGKVPVQEIPFKE